MKRIDEVKNNFCLRKQEKTNGKEYVLTKLGEFSIESAALIENYPPLFKNKYKSNLWARLCEQYSKGICSLPSSQIIVSQYENDSRDIDIIPEIDPKIMSVDYFFDYRPSTSETTRWYLNFADPNLFYAYGSNLFAQDEIQCLEHPFLCSIKEYLVSNPNHGISNHTKTGDVPTPVLIENVPYMVDVRTSIDIDGTRYSIYGNSFHATELSNPSILDKAITLKKDISASNIIAMCAPYPESGRYRVDTIDYMLKCALTAFGAAKQRNKSQIVEIHTGRWGAGAFGGNEELAILVQIIASKITGIDRLVFHAINKNSLENAKLICNDIFTKDAWTLLSMIEYLYSLEYEWGRSDEN